MDKKALIYFDLTKKCIGRIRKLMRDVDLRRSDIPPDIKQIIKTARELIFQFFDDENKGERTEEEAEESSDVQEK